MSREEIAAIKTIASRALKFQEYMTRRAWGLYYSAWALAFSLYSIFPYILSSYYPLAPAYVYFILYGGTGLFGMLATSWIFKTARKTIELKYAALGRRHGTFGLRAALIMWLFIALLFAVVFIFSRSAFNIVYLGVLVFVEAFIYRAIRISFSSIPPEGYLALGTFAFSILFTSLVGFSSSYLYLLIGWVPSIAGWLLASIYALYHAPESMVE